MLELNKIYNMDCLGGMKQLDDNSVQLAILDPPYYKIKDNDWDNQWKNFNEYLNWLENICLEIKRVLKENGSLYIFGDDERIAYVQVRLDKHFTFLNHLIWYKVNNTALKWASNHRKFCPMSERILFYSVQKSKTGLECIDEKYIRPNNPMAIYLKKEFERANVSCIAVADACGFYGKVNHGGMVSNWLSGNSLPSKEQYLKMRSHLNNEYLREKYEYLREKYEDLREKYEDLRRPFNYQYNVHEIITEPIIQSKENTNHPTTKPTRLIRKLINASSVKGDVILDPFMGSGTTAVACIETIRHFIGFESNKEYYNISLSRLLGDKKQSRIIEG